MGGEGVGDIAGVVILYFRNFETCEDILVEIIGIQAAGVTSFNFSVGRRVQRGRMDRRCQA
jgi:hypothetical protein